MRIIGLRFGIKKNGCYGIPTGSTHIRFYHHHPEAHYIEKQNDAPHHNNGFWDVKIPEDAKFFLVKAIKQGKRSVRYGGVKFLNLA